MELRHLRYFVAVAEKLHFTKAAEQLHISQPPLSQQIQNLEEELGVKLFERGKRSIHLTDAGIFFLKEAKQILLHVEQAAETTRRVDRGETGRLAVGFVGSLVHTFLPKVFRLFRERFPHVELVIYELNSGEQIKALFDKRIDIGFLYPSFRDERLQFHTIIRAPIILAIPEEHPLSRHRKINVKELSQEFFIAFTRASEPVGRDILISICHSTGFSPKIAQEASQIQTVLGIVASGFGICFLPDHIKNIKRAGVLYKSLSGSPPKVDLAVAWKNDNHSPLIESFVRVSKAVIKHN
jgi:DNA-binding transcriptional LysR family regulator